MISLQYIIYRSISECHILLIAVNGQDCESVGKRLKMHELATHKFEVTIFSLVRGVKSSSAIKDEFGGLKHVAFLECVTGFAVVTHLKSDALKTTTAYPAIALERMSRAVEDIAKGDRDIHVVLILPTRI